MKKMVFFIFLFLISQAAFAAAKQCVRWNKVCQTEQHCVYREAKRENCFRCVKPNHYGFHLLPQQIDRNTCSLSSAHYLRTMGYRCYQPQGAQKCVKMSPPVKKCHMECVD